MEENRWADIRTWLERSLLSIGVIISFFATIYVGYLAIHLQIDNQLDADRKFRLLAAATVIIGFGMGLFQFSAAAARQRRESVMTEVTDILQEISEVRIYLRKQGIDLTPMLQAVRVDDYRSLAIKLSETLREDPEDRGPPFSLFFFRSGVPIKTLSLRLLNHMERIAVGIRHGVYDPDLTYDFAGHLIVRSWLLFSDFIHCERIAKGWPSFARELEWLAKKWGIAFRADMLRDIEWLRQMRG